MASKPELKRRALVELEPEAGGRPMPEAEVEVKSVEVEVDEVVLFDVKEDDPERAEGGEEAETEAEAEAEAGTALACRG